MQVVQKDQKFDAKEPEKDLQSFVFFLIFLLA